MRELNLIGEVFAERYRVEDKLGAGGWGTVYRAYDVELDRRVALKLLNPDLLLDRDSSKRFQREAQCISALHHPNIVQLYSFGIEGQLPYFAMELVDGRSLHSVIAERRYTALRTTELALELCSALETAHQNGVLHRDLTPNNVLIRSDGSAVIIDFGLAKVLSAQPVSAQQLTQSGCLIGTPWYMSPEQACGRPATEQSDVYSLACVLYFCLTGAPPFESESAMGILFQHAHAAPPHVMRRVEDCTPWLDELIYQGMIKEPQQRIASVSVFKQVLTTNEPPVRQPLRATIDRHDPPRHVRLLLSVAVVTLLGLMAATSLLRERTTESTDVSGGTLKMKTERASREQAGKKTLLQCEFEYGLFKAKRALAVRKYNVALHSIQRAIKCGREIGCESLPDAYEWQTEICQRAGAFEKARSSWNDWHALQSELHDSQHLVHRGYWRRLADIDAHERKFGDAAEDLRRAVSGFRGNEFSSLFDWRLFSGAAEFLSGQHDAAVLTLNSLLSDIPDNTPPAAIAHLILAAHSDENHRSAEALDHLRRFRKRIKPAAYACSLKWPALIKLERSLSGKYPNADPSYQRWQLNEGRQAQVLTEQADRDFKENKFRIAADRYLLAIGKFNHADWLPSPQLINAYEARTNALFKLGQFAEAGDAALGAYYLSTQEFGAVHPTVARLEYLCGSCYQGCRKWRDAEQFFERSLECLQRLDVADLRERNELINIAQQCLELANFPRAYAVTEYASTWYSPSSKSYALTVFQQAEAFEGMQRKAEARAAFQKFIMLGYGTDLAAQLHVARQRVKELRGSGTSKQSMQ